MPSKPKLPRSNEPDPPYTLAQVAAAAGISPRTARFWAKQRLLGTARFRGPATRYSREHLVTACAIAVLREQGLRYRQIQQRLAKLHNQQRKADIEAIAAPKLAVFDAPAAPPATPTAAPEAGWTAPPDPSYPAERWERLVLLPGLEVHVNPAGGPVLRRIAQQIYACFALGASPPPGSSALSG